MNDYADLIDYLDRRAVREQALVALTADLKELRSLKSIADSLDARIATSNSELAGLEPKLAQAMADVAAANEEAASIKADADSTAKGVRLQAELAASVEVGQAKAKADAMLSDAKRAADNLINAGKAAKIAAEQDASDAGRELSELRADIKSANEELAAVIDKHAKAKAAVAEMLK